MAKSGALATASTLTSTIWVVVAVKYGLTASTNEETTPTLHDMTVLLAPPDRPANDHVISSGYEPLLTDMV